MGTRGEHVQNVKALIMSELDKKKDKKTKRQKAIDYLGGKCIICGYNKYYGSIDLHHLDPSKKDSNFSSLRGWSWKKIKKEIINCVPLCKTCHGEVHGGIIKISLNNT